MPTLEPSANPKQSTPRYLDAELVEHAQEAGLLLLGGGDALDFSSGSDMARHTPPAATRKV